MGPSGPIFFAKSRGYLIFVLRQPQLSVFDYLAHVRSGLSLLSPLLALAELNEDYDNKQKDQEDQSGNTEKNTYSIGQIAIDHIARLNYRG